MDEWSNNSMFRKDDKRILQSKEELFFGVLLGSKTNIFATNCTKNEVFR